MKDKERKKRKESDSTLELTPLLSRKAVQITVKGMTCTSCTNSVESRIRDIKGVLSVSVSLLQELAEVHYDSITSDPSTFVKVIREAGFEAHLKSHEAVIIPHNIQVCHLKILGMVCTSCTNTITKELKNTKGICSFEISLVLGEANIEYSTNSIQPEQIVERIEHMGFGARIIHNAKSDHIILSVPDMISVGVGDKLEEVLTNTSGVLGVSLTLPLHEIEITFDSEMIGPRDLVTLIRNLGYSAQLVDHNVTVNPAKEETMRWKRLFQWSLLFTVPVAIMAILLPRTPVIEDIIKKEVLGIPFDVLFKWILTTPVQFILGWRFQIGAFNALKHGSANMDVLVAIGTDASYAYSVISVLAHLFRGHGQDQYTPTDFFETSALLITFIMLGRYLESTAKGKTSDAISKLIHLIPDTAILVSLGQNNDVLDEEEIEAPLIQKGDCLKIYPGARIPADGAVLSGQSHVNESMITGESLPVPKHKDSTVIGGTVNTGGTLIMKAHRVGADTALSQIVRLVEAAQLSKAPVQYIADRISLFFVPIVICIAFITWFIWYISGIAGGYPEDWLPQGHDYFLFSLLFGIAVLVIACPCALGLATPTAVMVGTGIGAQLGILIKGGDALEKAHNVDTIVFDKTGTLTLGKPTVIATEIFKPNIQLKELYSMLAAAEQDNAHPLSAAIMKEAERLHKGHENISADNLKRSREWMLSVKQSELRSGRGVLCWIEISTSLAQRLLTLNTVGPSSDLSGFTEIKFLVGNRQFLEEESIPISKEIEKYCRQEQSLGNTVVFAAVESALLGAVSICDPPKPEAASVIAALTEKNIECYMVTGDNWTTARSISKKLGIRNVLAEVLPACKAKKVEELQKDGHVVAMIGDGINDAPALASADVGMAIGSGTDTAIEAADYVLMHDNLEDVLTAIDLSKKTFSRIKMNYFWAFSYNTLMIPVAAGVFYPFVRLQLPPWVAGGAMALSSLSVVISSLLLRRYKKPHIVDLYSIK